MCGCFDWSGWLCPLKFDNHLGRFSLYNICYPRQPEEEAYIYLDMFFNLAENKILSKSNTC